MTMLFLRALNAVETCLGRGSSSHASICGGQVWWFSCSGITVVT